MNDEPKDPFPSTEIPQQPTTKTLPAVNPNTILFDRLRDHFDKRFDELDVKWELKFSVLSDRVKDSEDWQDHTEDRLKNHSTNPSKVDVAQSAELAAEIVARQALAKQVQDALGILVRLDSFAKHPTIKLLLAVGFIMLSGWLAARGIHIQ